MMRKLRKLSPRQMEVVKLIAKGYSNKEIADVIHISFHTVKSYIQEIYYSLRVKNRTQLIVKVLKKNIISLEEL